MPPEILTFAVPELSLKQNKFVPEIVVVNNGGSIIFAESTAIQLFASVTVKI